VTARITADPERCIGSGQCVLTAPDIFDQDEDGAVHLLTEAPDEGRREVVAEAVRGCPVGAIRFVAGEAG
jgi:ferredoxin